MSKERLEELAYNVGISLDGEKALMSSDDYDFLYNYALEQAELVQDLERQNDVLSDSLSDMPGIQKGYIKNIEQQNKRYREVIASMKSEINYALHSNKSKDVKRFYLENAVRYADEALESGSE